MAYSSGFAKVYDKFTRNTDVEKRAAYIASLLRRYGATDGILLDLACGTGTLSEAFIRMGFDVISVDASFDMLTKARERLSPYGAKALVLQQDMRDIDLYGTFRACVCSLDSINHLTEPQDVQRVFDRVSLFAEPGSVFVFDVNTVYKHKNILCNQTFVYEDDDDFLVWQNEYDPEDDTVQMLLDIFSYDGKGRYLRDSDEITERAYAAEDLKEMLIKAGFGTVEYFGDLREDAPTQTEERIYFAAVK